MSADLQIGHLQLLACRTRTERRSLYGRHQNRSPDQMHARRMCISRNLMIH